MKVAEKKYVWISACLLAFASSACAAEGAAGDESEDVTADAEGGASVGLSAGAATNEDPLVVATPETAESTMGRERFGGHPEPWTPPPWPGPKPTK